MNWLLSIPYFVMMFVISFAAWFVGGLAGRLLVGSKTGGPFGWQTDNNGLNTFLLCTRAACGLAIISWLATVLGVAGQFTIPAVSVVLVLLVIIVAVLTWQFPVLRSTGFRANTRKVFIVLRHATRGEKLFTAGVFLATCLVLANAFIGALVPDMNQDAMWYHLSVPQQWTFSGKFDAYPNVMQSSFPLAAEALFAVILLYGGDPVTCSLLSVFCGVGFYCSLLSVTWTTIEAQPVRQSTGWGVMAVLAVAVPLLSIYGLTAPVQAKNDVITMFWAFTGSMLLILPVLVSHTGATTGWWVVGGFLLGTACSAKPPVLSMTFFVLLFATSAAAWYEYRDRRQFPVNALVGSILSLLMMGIAALPWMIRGYLSHGVPLYPVGSSMFSISSEFIPLDRSQTSIQGVPGLDLKEWLLKLQQFPDRLLFGATNSEMFVFLYLLTGVFLLFLRQGLWRWYGVMLLSQLVFLVGIDAAIEVFRLFSPVYALAAPAMGMLVARFAIKLGQPVRYFVAAAIWLTVLASVGTLQMRIARLSNRQWEFRPILTQADIVEYAGRVKKEVNYENFGKVRPFIDKDERVLLLGTPYPFYLHRDALWNDEAIEEGGLADTWHKMTSEQAALFLQQEEIDVILYTNSQPGTGHPASPVKGLLENGNVTKVTIPKELQQQNWALYRVIIPSEQ